MARPFLMRSSISASVRMVSSARRRGLRRRCRPIIMGDRGHGCGAAGEVPLLHDDVLLLKPLIVMDDDLELVGPIADRRWHFGLVRLGRLFFADLLLCCCCCYRNRYCCCVVVGLLEL